LLRRLSEVSDGFVIGSPTTAADSSFSCPNVV